MHAMRTISTVAVLVMAGLSMASAADVPHPNEAHGVTDTADRAVGSRMPPKLRGLLIQEMLALLDASKQILEALTRGQNDLVARNAQAIHDSFILEQGMSDADRQAFHDSVPHAFVERDQAFHDLSERLANAARQGDQLVQRKLFSEMLDACVTCHAAHATDRFPTLSPGAH